MRITNRKIASTAALERRNRRAGTIVALDTSVLGDNVWLGHQRSWRASVGDCHTDR